MNPNVTTKVEEEAQTIIRNHAFFAAGTGLIPLPGLDIAATTFVQLEMIRKLSDLYRVPYDVLDVKTILTSLSTSGLSRLIAYGVNTYTTLFSELGSFSDNLTNGLVSGAATYGTGEIINIHFQKGGTIDNLNFTHFFDYYSQKLESGDFVPAEIAQIEKGLRSAISSANI